MLRAEVDYALAFRFVAVTVTYRVCWTRAVPKPAPASVERDDLAFFSVDSGGERLAAVFATSG